MNDTLILTIIFAILLMGLAVAGLGIGLILTGKSKLRRGCGYSPEKKKTTCSLCGDQKRCDEQDDPSRKV